MKKILFYFIVILLTIGCSSKKSNEITIGAILPLTGNVASYGLDSKDGIDLAVKLINESQDKYDFKVVYQDNKGEAKTAVSVLQQMLLVNKPSAIIGGNLSSTTSAMIPVIDKSQTILISPTASAPNLSGLSNYFFRVFPSDVEEGSFMAKHIANSVENPQICIVYVNNDYGVGLKDVFEKTAADNNLKILEIFGIEKGANDFRAILTKIKALKPNVIYMPMYYEEGGIFTKQVKELGIDAQLFGSTTLEDPKLLELAAGTAEGLQIPVSTGYNENSQNESVKYFLEEFNKAYNKKPGLVSALGYDCAKLVVDGIISKGVSSENLRDYFLTTKKFSGAAGIMNFDENGDVHKPILLKQVINNSFQVVK